ncbi:MAG TPA: hypothetical protein PLL92_00875 [Alicycliphilus sp.]|nr:hypothetical protein [Alicycliphilus sp.]
MASGVAALSLGPSRGAVVLGSPIDLMFEVRPDAGKDLSSSCLSAHLVSGATTISDSRVQVTPVLGGAVPMVRVQARITADEPVLTVTLAAGCEGRVTRTYTFLADPPSAAQAAVQRSLDLAGTAARGGDGRPDAGAPAARPRGLARALDLQGEDTAPLARAAARPARPATPKTVDKPLRPRALAPDPAAPRLVVEPLDLWLDTPLTLRLSREEPLLISPPDEAKRAQFAALRKALNAAPESLQESIAQLDKLQADAAAQGQQLQAEQATVAELRQRLEQVEAHSFSATWVYGLGGLLALAVGAVAWLARRPRREELQAWRHSVARNAGLKNGAVAFDGPDGQQQWQVEPDAQDTWQPSSVPPQEEPGDHLPVDAPDTVPVGPSAVATEPAPLDAATAPAAPKAARVQQIVPPEAVFDIQQQAEFFISIGEHEQAIEVLRAHIEEHGDAMPWAYLELLRLFHMLGRTQSFNRLREQFQERFNVRVPGFGQFQNGGHCLDDYSEALAEIEALWSSPDVMGVLDGFLFRRDAQHEVERFDLEAFDDLLLLLAIAQTTPAHLRGAPPPRARTTPRVNANANRVSLPPERSLDSVAGDLTLMPSGYDVLTPQPEHAALDVDLSQLRAPDIALSDDSAVSAAHPPAVGFGMDSDKFELSFELDQMDKKRF